MTNPARLLRLLWPLVPIGALAFVVWTAGVRIERVEFVTRTAQEGATVDARSPTGWADGKRWLIVPEHNNPTYQWIEETQLMLARHGWRIRRIAYENSPIGRDVQSASPYRWWLVAVGSLRAPAPAIPLPSRSSGPPSTPIPCSRPSFWSAEPFSSEGALASPRPASSPSAWPRSFPCPRPTCRA